MPRYLIALCFILFCTLLHAQDGPKFYSGLSVEPGISWLIFDEPDFSPASQSVHTALAGHVVMNLSPRFQASLGLGFRYLDVDQFDSTSIWGCDQDVNGGVDLFHSWVELDFTLIYLSVPIELKWKFRPGGNSVYVKAGGSGEILLDRTGSATLFECGLPSSIMNWTAHEPMNFILLGRIGVGYEWKVQERSTFFMEPYFCKSFKECLNP